MRAENLERRLNDMRKEYFEGIDRRVSDYNTRGYTNDKAFTKWEGKLQRSMAMLRAELAQQMPNKYFFGRENKSKFAIRYGSSKKLSKYGDNGFWICEKCKELFKFDYMVKGMQKRETFANCSEHKELKSIGTVRICMNAEDYYGA